MAKAAKWYLQHVEGNQEIDNQEIDTHPNYHLSKDNIKTLQGI